MNSTPGPGLRAPSAASLGGTYFLLLASSGAFSPFVALHLARLGWSGEATAALFAGTALLWMLAGPGWGLVADRAGRPGRLFLALAVVAGASQLAFALGAAPLVVTLGLVGWAAFRGGLTSLLDGRAVVALVAAGRSPLAYGRVRLWGSVGYLAAALAAGVLAEAGTGVPLALSVPPLLWAAWRVARLDRGAARSPAAAPAALRLTDVTTGDLGRLLRVGVLHGAALAAYDGWFALLVEARGLSPAWTGAGLAAGVVAEVAVMRRGGALLARHGPRALLVASGLAMAVRLVGSGLVLHPLVLVALQGLHGLAFGAWWLGAVETARRAAPAGRDVSAQGLLASATYGVGPVLCQVLAATVVDGAGVAALFVGSAAFAAAGAWAARGLDRVSRTAPAGVALT